MQTVGAVEAPQTIGFLLVPNFSLIAVTSAMEPLRLANWVAGTELYRWRVITVDGGPVTASSGMTIHADCGIDDVELQQTLFVCGGINIHEFDDPKVYAWLRRLARRGGDVGALCTGSFVLARAGLLDGYRCTIHWENLPSFTEEFPDIDVLPEIYQIDRNRWTCAGGTAALDMMLHVIARQFGDELALTVSDELIHDRIREAGDQQRLDLRLRLGVSHPKLLLAASIMEKHLEQPLGQEELAGMVGLSTRQLERLFSKYLGQTPTRYYLDLRLVKARQLLLQTSLSVLNVALACGFVSASHFSKSYREHFGHTPREERRPVH